MNYIYGTWSVLCALMTAGVSPQLPAVRRAVDWLIAKQNADGGWGESGESYGFNGRGHQPVPSTASQTAWALLALMAVGELRKPGVSRGIDYLLPNQESHGFWSQPQFTAPGVPPSFFLPHPCLPKSFPLWGVA